MQTCMCKRSICYEAVHFFRMKNVFFMHMQLRGVVGGCSDKATLEGRIYYTKKI